MIYLITYFAIGVVIISLAYFIDSGAFEEIAEEFCDENPDVNSDRAMILLFCICAIFWPIFFLGLIVSLVQDWKS